MSNMKPKNLGTLSCPISGKQYLCIWLIPLDHVMSHICSMHNKKPKTCGYIITLHHGTLIHTMAHHHVSPFESIVAHLRKINNRWVSDIPQHVGARRISHCCWIIQWISLTNIMGHTDDDHHHHYVLENWLKAIQWWMDINSCKVSFTDFIKTSLKKKKIDG